MNYTLPKSLRVCGTEYGIRWDFRAALDLCAALCDPELDGREKAIAALLILYPDFEAMPPEHYEEALRRAFWFLKGGEPERETAQRLHLMDWEQDFPLIVGPVNRVLGADVRGMEQLHWWSFLAAYMEIGDCAFAQIVRIRRKLQRGEKLDKGERAYYRENRELIDLQTKYSSEDDAVLALWGGQGTETR